MTTLDVLRRFYGQLVTRSAGVHDPRIADAFATVERERFVGPGPWQIKVLDGYLATGTDDPAVLYQDILVGLVPEKGLNNGEPSLHARCIGAAAPQPGERAIHIGAGTGYYTAILAQLVGASGRVDAFEIDPALAHRARENLATYNCIAVHAESAVGPPLPTADLIYVSAGVTGVPTPWLDALDIGGRLLLPLTPTNRLGCMLLVTRWMESRYAARVLSPAAFIPCVGAQNDEQSRALAAVMTTWSPADVRSLLRGYNPNEAAWRVGTDCWLSTTEP